MVPFLVLLVSLNLLSTWATILGAMPVLAAVFYGCYRSAIKINKVLSLADHELKPNGGDSVSDNARKAKEHSEEALNTAKRAADAAERAADGVATLQTHMTAFVTASAQTTNQLWAAIEELRHDPDPREGPQIRAIR